MDPERARLTVSLLLSLLIHALLLRVLFGGEGWLRAFDFAWRVSAFHPPVVSVALAPPDAALRSSIMPGAQPAQEARVARPVAGGQVMTRSPSDAANPESIVARIVPRPAPNTDAQPAKEAQPKPDVQPVAVAKPKMEVQSRTGSSNTGAATGAVAAKPRRRPHRSGDAGSSRVPPPDVIALERTEEPEWNVPVTPMMPAPDFEPLPSLPGPETTVPSPQEADDRAQAGNDRDASESAIESTSEEAARQAAAQQEAERQEAARQEAARQEAAQQAAGQQEAQREEAEGQAAAQREAQRQEAQLQEAARQETERQEAERQAAAQQEAQRQETQRQESARREAAREAAAQQEAQQQEAARQEAERQAAAQQEAQRQEAARQEAERQATAQQEAQRQEAARQEAERQAAAQQEAQRQEVARQEAERQAVQQEAQRQEAARREAERQAIAQQDAARQAAAQQEAARQAAAQQDAARQAAAQQEAQRQEAARQYEAQREERLRAIGRQLDEEAARREAASNAGSRSTLPLSLSLARRVKLWGRYHANPELVRYAEVWARKIQANTPVETVREIAKQPHTAPLVTVAIRSDGSVESVTIELSSGVTRVDEALRRIVEGLKPYEAFPPELARVFDVIEIRRTWHFDSAVRLD